LTPTSTGSDLLPALIWYFENQHDGEIMKSILARASGCQLEANEVMIDDPDYRDPIETGKYDYCAKFFINPSDMTYMGPPAWTADWFPDEIRKAMKVLDHDNTVRTVDVQVKV